MLRSFQMLNQTHPTHQHLLGELLVPKPDTCLNTSVGCFSITELVTRAHPSWRPTSPQLLPWCLPIMDRPPSTSPVLVFPLEMLHKDEFISRSSIITTTI